MGRGRKKVFLHRRDISDQRCPTSLIIRKIQIKTTMRYYLTLFRMAITKKSTISKCWRGRGERELSYTAGGDVSGCSHYGKCIEVPQKLKLELPYDPAILLLGMYPEKKYNSKGYTHPKVHSSTIHNSQHWKNVHQQMNGQRKRGRMHIHNGILLSHKKQDAMPFEAKWQLAII